MIRAIEAVIDEWGQIHFAEPVKSSGVRRAIVTILDEQPSGASEPAILAETSLADWSRVEEDEAWAHLQ